MRYKMTIEPLTFIHIGSGNEMDPFTYNMGNGKFYRIDIGKFYGKLKNEEHRNEFNSIINELSNIDSSKDKDKFIKAKTKFRDFILRGINTLEKYPEKQKGIILYTGDVDKSLYEKYKENIDNFENQLLIFESMHRLPDFAQYIPGSSIKGAIRTAMISYIINTLGFERKDFPFEERNNRDYQKNPGRSCEGDILRYRIFNDKYKTEIQKDPFRVLQITDTEPFARDSLIISETKNFGMKTKSPLKLQIICEYIKSNSKSSFEININDKLLFSNFDAVEKESKFMNGKGTVKFSDLFHIKKIAEACNLFYKQKLKDEYNNYFNKINGYKIACKDEIESAVDSSKNEFLIRIGRFSQFESVTLDKLRSKNNIFNSRMLVLFNDKYYPAGWAKVKWEEINSKK
ncbi:MAG: type III-A CRISPR-associated RAMP protein Csm5 [Spirochaetota bacterium]